MWLKRRTIEDWIKQETEKLFELPDEVHEIIDEYKIQLKIHYTVNSKWSHVYVLCDKAMNIYNMIEITADMIMKINRYF